MTPVTRWAFWLFAICCLVVLGAMAWLTSLTLQLDRQDADAQRRAEREEDTRLALWRMDSVLAPLVSQETTRPYFHFTAFYPVVGSYTASLKEFPDGDVFAPSPLVTYSSRFVRLHFQLDSTGQLSSPQAPSGVMRETLQRQLGAQFTPNSRQVDLDRCQQLLKSHQVLSRAVTICGDEFQVVSRNHAGLAGQGLAMVCTPVATASATDSNIQAGGAAAGPTTQPRSRRVCQ